MESPAKRELIDRQVAFHIDQLSRNLNSGLLKKEEILNSVETHSINHLYHNQTLSKHGDTEIKYADVVSRGDGLTMMVTLRGNCIGHMEVPLFFFLFLRILSGRTQFVDCVMTLHVFPIVQPQGFYRLRTIP